MALHPHTFSSKETLQPGARGETFRADMPGYRGGEERINRTNMKLAASQHDVPNIKWEMDSRLPVLFTYGYAYGYNQLVMPKGRIVAVDPSMNQLDFDTRKSNNVLTLANGGKNVKLRTIEESNGKLGKLWEEITEPVSVDTNTGLAVVGNAIRKDVRLANKPLGVIQRNEYTRDDNAYNGMQPGAVLTDAMIELPLFLEKAKAEGNPWGSIYGPLLPGDLVKADCNGRLISSPLNSASAMNAAGLTTAALIELERQQVVGQVYSISRDLVPAGAARFAQWALSDRMNFDQFNPEMMRGNNRRGEDINENSPYTLGGGGAINGGIAATPGVDPLTPQGYPYDQTMTQHDLHMLASSARKADNRFGLDQQLENGIPGLTDGYNAVIREYRPEVCGEIRQAASANEFVEMFMKLSEVNVANEEGNKVKIALTTKDKSEVVDADFTVISGAGQLLNIVIKKDGTTTLTTPEEGEGTTPDPDTIVGEGLIRVKYFDTLQGFFVLEAVDKNALYAFFTTNAGILNGPNGAAVKTIKVIAKFSKRGLSGVPTFMDWDGCQGYASILLQK